MALATQSKKERFYEVASKDAFFVDTDAAGLDGYLRRRAWLEDGESVLAAEVAGQGNMNYIARVVTNLRSFVLKQARPWVEKYPDIPAPFDRALMEAEFYRLVDNTSAASFMPKVHWVDGESRVLCLEDLGTLGDFTNVYRGVEIDPEELKHLCQFLSLLHCSRSSLANREMRALNHFHIFVFPFRQENGLNLDKVTPGLEQIGRIVKSNPVLERRVAALGEIYLSDGDYLLHGDYFPGSWLRGAAGVKIIDPEFGFSGPREFDLGVMLAHFLISGMENATASVCACYSHWRDLDRQLVHGFAGAEILRRLLGVAQLPISFALERKQKLIDHAVQMVLA